MAVTEAETALEAISAIPLPRQGPAASPPALSAAPLTDPCPKTAANPETIAILFRELHHQAGAGNSRKCREAIDGLAALDLPAYQTALLDQARRLLELRNYPELRKLPLADPS